MLRFLYKLGLRKWRSGGGDYVTCCAESNTLGRREDSGPMGYKASSDGKPTRSARLATTEAETKRSEVQETEEGNSLIKKTTELF